MNQSFNYKFFENVLSEEEISEELKCKYPWLFNVEYFLFDQETGKEIFTSESYYALYSTAVHDVEDKWRWNNSVNIGGIELCSISLEEFNPCDKTHIN
jgi:hypothetical protein